MTSCERCGGTGFEIVTREGREYAVACACRKPGAASDPFDRFLEACRIPLRYRHCCLENFSPETVSQRAALEQVLLYCSKYPFMHGTAGLGLLFAGNNGLGKTHLAVSALRELALNRGAFGQFWDFHELVREIKNSYDPNTQTTELQVLAPVVEVDVLLLDDLGAWRMTDWMNDTLFYVLNSRYLAQRPTIVTTNFQDASIEEIKGADPLVRKEYFVERIGNRLRSRLREMCVTVKMDGPDFREESQRANRAAVLGRQESPEPPAKRSLQKRPAFGGTVDDLE